MNVPFVDLKAQYETIQPELNKAISSVINHTTFIGGEIVAQFETAFAEYVGVRHGIGVANGTDAIEIALKALGIGVGDEVIVPALTWISTAGAVSNVGAEPVFVDVLEDERTIDPALIEDNITSKTRAIIPVHLYGLSAQMDKIMRLSAKHNLKVIEDCAQAHGATYRGQMVGTFGDLATFSFYPGKNLGAYGDAGAITSNDIDLAQKCKMLSNHGQLQKHHHQLIGRNSRMDTVQAAILNVKLPHLDQWIVARNQVADWYDSLLTSVVKPYVPTESTHVFHLYVIQSEERDDLIGKLKQHQIGHAVHYPAPLPFLDCYRYKKHERDDFPVAEKLCREIISLPMFSEMTEMQVEKVCEVLDG